MKVWEVIRVIEESPVKAESSDSAGLDIVFRTSEGYRFEVFFDCGEPDYLNWFEAPDGTRIEFWGPSDAESTRATSAMAYLAGNLLHLPHVEDRLKIAAARLVTLPCQILDNPCQ